MDSDFVLIFPTLWKICVERMRNEFVGFFSAVTQILIVFVKMFKKSREENERQADADKRKTEKEAMKERSSVKAK